MKQRMANVKLNDLIKLCTTMQKNYTIVYRQRASATESTKARGYEYAKIEYVSVRTYLSKNRIRV